MNMPPEQNKFYTKSTLEQSKKTGHNPWIVPLSIIIAGALVGGGIYFSGSAPQKTLKGFGGSEIDTINVKPVDASDHILGNPNAPVVIIEFSDTECPFCKQFHPTMKRIISEYGNDGKVAWVYRHLPIDSLHTRARKEAEATECAAELGGNNKFWLYLDEIYKRTNSNDSLDPSELPRIAKDLGLDENQFNDCLLSGKMASKVQEDVLDASVAGARGTPYSILVTRNGDKVSINGAQPYDIVRVLVDTALENR